MTSVSPIHAVTRGNTCNAEALTDWQRRLAAWERALPGASGDEQVLLLCGIAVCVRSIRQIEGERAAAATRESPACQSR